MLVEFFMSRNLEDTAWENNININEMSSTTTEIEINSVISRTSVFMNDVLMLNEKGNQKFTGFFFRENEDIIAIVTRTPFNDGDLHGLSLCSERFFQQNDINPEMINAFIAVNQRYFTHVETNGTLILNATPVLNGLPVIVIFYKLQENDNSTVAAVFFSAESITTSFGTGTNNTMLINNFGDVLIATDQELLVNGGNLAETPFIKDVLDSNTVNLQKKFKDKEGREFLAVSKRLKTGNTITITTIPSDVVFEGIITATRRNILLSLAIWFLSMLFVWFFSKSISLPLRKLEKAVHNIENGMYHLEINNKKNNDETGILTRSVSSMSHVLENFESFTNKEIARLARDGSLNTAGIVKHITIFFSDIRSFTAISEKFTPNEVIEFLNEYMERMVDCVLVTNGAIDKFIGDAIMAYWGAITSAGSAEQDAFNGVKSALMMRALLKCFNKGRGGDKKPIIKIGCGLNSGKAVIGQIGSEERTVFTVIGEMVTLADRTETFNKPFGSEILITEHTYSLVKDYFITEKMGEIKENGKQLGIYAVINMCEGERLNETLAQLEKLSHTDREIVLACIGPSGPQTIEELRALLDIPKPDLTNINLEEEEKKYSVTTNNG
ncbi:MAG: adenylate/guanylate cyclase domain-containing protein [Spirochaetaceae bacterium]|jgi:adenylate cyclase|nr:adenylate/guanylate cyclase domain-containing protein [Spirochaetaceae bacterium]